MALKEFVAEHCSLEYINISVLLAHAERRDSTILGLMNIPAASTKRQSARCEVRMLPQWLLER